MLQERGEPLASLPHMRRVVTLAPQSAVIRWCTSLALLKAGEFEEAWKFYPSRWQTNGFRKSPKTRATQFIRDGLPEWRPGAQRILVWPEQGIGDEILYGSMLAEFFDWAPHSAVLVDPRIVPLFRRSVPGARVASLTDPVPLAGFDAHLPMGDLPGLFRAAADRFPVERESYLIADARSSAAHRSLLCPPEKRLVGISWRSQRGGAGAGKSLPLAALMPLFGASDCVFVNLQYGDTGHEVERLEREHGVTLPSCPLLDVFSNLDGLASLVDACDAVVTTSNSTAHLAGALGKRTAVLTPVGEGLLWYWCNQRGTRNLWYPSIRTFALDPGRPREHIVAEAAAYALG